MTLWMREPAASVTTGGTCHNFIFMRAAVSSATLL
jgi:hypothetical protein